MERNMKRILAIVIVLVIAGAGIGVGVWFLLTPPASVYETPGVSGIPDNRIIKVGLLGGLTDIQGVNNYEGAWLAAYNINTAGGIDVNGTAYYIGLVAEDTDESNPVLDVTKGVGAAEKILEVDGAEYIVGGFRTEALKAYVEVIMDAKKLFLGTGASTDYFCENVDYSYTRYKYWFRVMPINSSMLGSETITFLAFLRGYLMAVRGHNINKTAILREALDWTIPMYNALASYLPLLGFDQVIDIAYPITATATDFATYWNQIEAAGTQITIPVISAQGGIYMMSQYAALEPKCLIAGIDVQSQLDTFWEDTGGTDVLQGDCAYEIIMQSIVNTSKTPLTIPFWNQFVGRFAHEPLYTAVGAYDAIYLIADGINATQSFDTDGIITFIEGFSRSSPGIGRSISSPQTAFTGLHDVVEGWPFGVTLFVQWKPDGTKDCVTSGNLIYPDSIVTGPIVIPPWGINLEYP